MKSTTALGNDAASMMRLSFVYSPYDVAVNWIDWNGAGSGC